ncbi:MAG: hypothetical protein MRZ79_26825 [Bacteroidia bacterium]|nr:hypothetical protein [Bacteroidia bacterium]
MSLTTSKIILIILVAANLLSCRGQVRSSTSAQLENTAFKNGTLVSEIDQQIWAIHQDSKGNFWFGSNGKGIYHFDGQNLRQFTTNDGLTHNQVRGIQEDELGNIYIETHQGVSKFDGTDFNSLKLVKSPTNEWKLEPNDLWFSCNGNAMDVYRSDGIYLYELQIPKQEIEEALGIEENKQRFNPYTVYGIDKDKNGNLWLGTLLAGAFRYDGNSFLWIGEKELSELPDGRVPGVRSMLEDRDGNFWLSNFYSKYTIQTNTNKGYIKQKAVELDEELVKDKILYFNSGIIDKAGNLWMTTYRGGVWNYDGNSLNNYEVKNEKEHLLLVCIYQDKEGMIWLGTNNDGVYKKVGEDFVKFEPVK